MHRTTRWTASTAVLLCAWSFPSTARAQQGWSEGEWNEPTFTLKRVCEPRQARESHYYEIAPVGNSYRRVGVLGSQPGDNPAPSAKLELSNGLSAYLTVRADAPASFSARDGAHIGCLAQVTVRVPATFKKPVVVQFSLSALGRGDLDSFEVEVPPATTITQQLRGGVRTVHKNWSAKFGISGPSWSCARIPTGKAVPADQVRWRAEALLHSIPFMMGPIAALKSDYSEQFAVSGYVNGERLSADLICIYEGVATKKAASTLRVTPPQPPPAPPPALPSVKVTDDSEQAEEMRRLYQTFQRVREMQQRIEMTAAQLRVQAEAAAQLRARIRLLTEASQDEALTQVAREDAAEAAEKLQKHLHDLLNAQDKLIENIAPDYQELLLQTRNALDKSSNATHTQLTAICKALDQQFALLPLELFLAADRRSQFQNAAWQLSFHKEYQDVANRLRAVDYLRHGEPRAALYALRQSLEHNPNDPTTKQMLLDLEVACLRAFAAKATGDAALAREKFDEALMGKGERGWFNALKDFVTTGPGAFLSVATGKLQAQTNLAVTWQDEAAVTQAGVNLLIRLRHKGYSWQQIQQMKDTEFADALGRLAAATRQDPVKLDDLTTARMRASVRIALQNPDVKRLMAQSKDQFDSDRYNSYFATDSFDLTWIDHAADAVNIANVAGLLPGATIGKAGKVFGAGRQTQAMTLGEGLMSAMKIQQLALAMENSAAGRFALQQLAQFNKQTGIVSKTLAQMILDQGVVEFGRRFGGRPGEIAAEILTTVGATDLDSLLVALEKRGLKAAHIEALGERFLKKGETLAKTRLTPEHYAPQLNKALDALNAPQISAATAQEFRKIADDLAKRPAPRPPTAALGASDDALRLELHKQQILQDAFDAASRGERGKLRAAKDYIQSLEKQIADEAKHLEHVTDSATKVSKKLKEKPANPPLVQHTGAGETASNVGGGSRAPAPSSTPGGGTTGGAKKPTTTKLGNDALVDARMTENLGPLAQQADEAFFRQQYQEARIRYSLLLDRDDIPAKTRQDLQQRLKLIEQLQTTRNEQQDAELVMRLGGKANQHTRDFDPDTMQYLNSVKQSDLVPFEGKGTFAKPARILAPATLGDNAIRKEIAVFKPARVVTDSGEILATGVEGELLAAKLGPMIGVEVPAVARITVRGEQGAVDGIAIRWVDDHVKLQNATVAQMLHAKQQIAEVKAMRAFIADHDGHDGNLLLLRNGKVVSIDHGMAALLEEGFRNPTDSSEQARAIIRRAMERRAAVAGEQHPNIRLIDKYIRYEDMEGVVNKITQLSETQLRELVQAAYAGSGATPHEINLALENLRIRQQLLPEVMRQRYPPAKPPAAPPPEPSAP